VSSLFVAVPAPCFDIPGLRFFAGALAPGADLIERRRGAELGALGIFAAIDLKTVLRRRNARPGANGWTHAPNLPAAAAASRLPRRAAKRSQRSARSSSCGQPCSPCECQRAQAACASAQPARAARRVKRSTRFAFGGLRKYSNPRAPRGPLRSAVSMCAFYSPPADLSIFANTQTDRREPITPMGLCERHDAGGQRLAESRPKKRARKTRINGSKQKQIISAARKRCTGSDTYETAIGKGIG